MGESALVCPLAASIDELVARTSILVVGLSDSNQVAGVIITVFESTTIRVLTAAGITPAVATARLSGTATALLALGISFAIIGLGLARSRSQFVRPLALILKATRAFLEIAAIDLAGSILLLRGRLLLLDTLAFLSGSGSSPFSWGTIIALSVGVLCIATRSPTTTTTSLSIGGRNAVCFVFESLRFSHDRF